MLNTDIPIKKTAHVCMNVHTGICTLEPYSKAKLNQGSMFETMLYENPHYDNALYKKMVFTLENKALRETSMELFSL